jgi:hypothetical protein
MVEPVPNSRRSRRPHSSPLVKVDERIKALILAMGKNRKLGSKRIQSELNRLHAIPLSVAATHKVLTGNNCKPLVNPPRKKTEYKRCCRPVPGGRVQMGTFVK